MDEKFRPSINQNIELQIFQLRKLVRNLNWQCSEMQSPIFFTDAARNFFTPEMFDLMERIAKKALVLATLMIHQRRQGHLASTASALHIMTAIYFSRVLDWLRYERGEEREFFYQFESHKPHAVPGWYGLLYLEGLLSKEQIQAFRTFKGPNAYPTHEDIGIQIPTGSLGLGPVAAIGMAFLNQYNYDHDFNSGQGLQISIIGDSEFDEGVIFESIKERASRGIKGWLEFIDYNRQSLDGNLDERLVDRIIGVYESCGIPVIILKYGSILQRLFAQGKAGAELRRRLDLMSTEDYQALLRQPGEVIREILTLENKDFDTFLQEGMRSIREFLADIGQGRGKLDPELKALFNGKKDHEVKEAFANLGGHDLPMLVAAIEKVKYAGGGMAVIAYTVKGWGIESLIGSLSGHWAKLSDEEIKELFDSLGKDVVTAGKEWERFNSEDPAGQVFSKIARARGKFFQDLGNIIQTNQFKFRNCFSGDSSLWRLGKELPSPYGFDPDKPVSTQDYLGGLFGRLGKIKPDDILSPLVDRIVTMAADVAFTAGLKDWINLRGVWGPPAQVDIIRKYGEIPEMNVQARREGQHIRLSNLEQFLGLLAASFGKSAEFTGTQLFPFAFFYDVFLERFAEMFKYAAYWDATVWYIGTIAGASAPEESGLHHGMVSGVIGRMTPNVITWEPTFPQELNWIITEEFRRAVLGEDVGRKVRYIRTTASRVRQQDMIDLLKKQERFLGMEDEEIYNIIREDVLAGGYCLVDYRKVKSYDPSTNGVNLFCIGPITFTVIKASQQLEKEGIFANVIVVTSPDLLIDNKDNYQLFKLVPEKERFSCTPLITICAGHPLYLSGIASRLALGRCQPKEVNLGVSRFDRSGTEEEILSFHKINSDSIIETVRSVIHEVQ